MLDLLADKGLTNPDAIGIDLDGVPVDLVFHDRRAAVVFDYPAQETVDTVPLLMSGWNVLHIPAEGDLEEWISANPSVFGGGAA